MKALILRVTPILVVAALALGFMVLNAGDTVFAAKPQDVIAWSNGYPSGAHFNLNIHGKKDGYNCDPSSGGSSVFIPEYTKDPISGENKPATIQYVSNKKSSVTELIALDRCAEHFDGDPIKVQIPKEDQGYYVFARVKGKPQNGKDSEESSILMVPNPVIEACNDTLEGNPDFGDYIDCSNADDDLLALGLVTAKGVYELTQEGLVRFDDSSPHKGKGKATATDITGLFLWTGYACDDSLDITGDGVLDESDVPIEYDLAENGGNENGVIDPEELNNYLADMEEAGLCTFYENEWVFNVADLVVQDQEITNDGVKLLKIRFYPVSTTEFIR